MNHKALINKFLWPGLPFCARLVETILETQGLLGGTMQYFWAKVYFKSWRAPGNFREMFSMEFYQKTTVPTRVTHCTFRALQNFHSDHCLKHFCEFPNNISFSFLLQQNKTTQSVTIVLTLWIYRTENELQSCILVWRDSKKRSVHCN